MAVIAISAGIDTAMLSDASIWYSILLVLLATTGLIRRLQHFFSVGLIRGIPLGVGLLLAQKSIELALQKGFFLHAPQLPPLIGMAAMAALTLILVLAMRSGYLPYALGSQACPGFSPPLRPLHWS